MTKNNLTVEYLVVIDSVQNFCNDEESMINLLKSNSDVKISKVEENSIEYKEILVLYKIIKSSLEDKETVFDIDFTLNDSKNLHIFEEFIRSIRVVLGKASNNVHTLKDDISFYYSKQGYPVIHKVENLMRKLITKFMITNIGLSWTDKNVPMKVQLSYKGAKKTNNLNYLYDLDFIQLSAFLFEEYSHLSSEELLETINSTKDINSLNLENLKEFVPMSNWNRYFSKIVDGEQQQLQKDWSTLYGLRNKIAHNSLFHKSDYENLLRVSKKVDKILEKAINSLDQIHISTKEKEIISNNIFQDNKNYIPEFYDSLNDMYNSLINLAKSKVYNISFETFEQLEEFYLINKFMPEEIISDAKNVHEFNLRIVGNEDKVEGNQIRHWERVAKYISNYIWDEYNIATDVYF